MWTPKRVLLLLGGLSLSLFTYIVYSFFFGGIDGLPPLVEKYWAGQNAGPIGPDRENETEVNRKLKEAFGDDCQEVQRNLKFEIRSRGLALATNEFKIIEEDKKRIQLVPFSIAIFGKARGEGALPEINTVRCDEAFLIFDQPINHMGDVNDRKIVGAELHGKITLINNRRTPQKNDDIDVHINKGPLFYSEPKNKIWSDGFIRLKDTQPQPEPTDITAVGLDIFLSKEAPDALNSAKAASPKKSPSKTVTGVNKLVLRSEVDMHFHVDAQSGFLGSLPARKETATPAEKKPALVPDKLMPGPQSKPTAKLSHVIVKTQGPFIYDVDKDLALFQSPDPAAAQEPDSKPKYPSGFVQVIRIHQDGEGEFPDQLLCDRLELQFRRKKEEEAKGAKQGQGANREIESARATVRRDDKAESKRQVTVALSTDGLHAFCDELTYSSPNETRGPETILRGEPMCAHKDGHRITAQEVRLIGANKKGEGQFAFAKGPGQLDLIDHHSKIKTPLYHAVWQGGLTITKDKEQERIYDLLTFTGEAGFIDDLHKQELHADRLMVWLEQAERHNADLPAQPKKQKSAGGPRQQPHKLEGFDKVWVRSLDLNVDDCAYLIVRFKNEVGTRIPEALPALAEGILDGKPGGIAAKPAHVTLTVPASPAPGLPPLPPPLPGSTAKLTSVKTQTTPGTDKKPRQPIDLKAKRVSVDVLRTGTKNELKEVFTEGKVHVRQLPADNKGKEVDIKGEMLHLLHHPDGDTLNVFGDASKPTEFARLQMGDMVLVGPEVIIDQQRNEVQVKGMGGMELPSEKNLDGTPAKKPGLQLTIQWNKDMFFDGEAAAFQGGVVAYQEKSEVRCHTLHVYLDRRVSFKEGEQKGQGAKVERLVCAGKDGVPVDIQDLKLDDKEQFVRQDRMVAKGLTMDNQDGSVNASGPGRVDMLQQGTVNGEVKNPKAQKQLYLTRVGYQVRLQSYKDKDNNRVATFLGGVEVFHVPSNTMNVTLSPDKLIKGGSYLSADKLKVYSRPQADGKTSQEMHAEGNVYFQTDGVKGTAMRVKYSQDSEIVILEGTLSNRAVLQKIEGPGIEPNQITGTSIIYNRKTGEYSLAGGGSIQGSSK